MNTAALIKQAEGCFEQEVEYAGFHFIEFLRSYCAQEEEANGQRDWEVNQLREQLAQTQSNAYFSERDAYHHGLERNKYDHWVE
jgi:hypothetical protein